MTPKEKAIELVNKFGKIKLGLTENGEPYLMAQESFREAKQCALIAVYEILDVIVKIFETYDERKYWKEVEKEIQEL